MALARAANRAVSPTLRTGIQIATRAAPSTIAKALPYASVSSMFKSIQTPVSPPVKILNYGAARLFSTKPIATAPVPARTTTYNIDPTRAFQGFVRGRQYAELTIRDRLRFVTGGIYATLRGRALEIVPRREPNAFPEINEPMGGILRNVAGLYGRGRGPPALRAGEHRDHILSIIDMTRVLMNIFRDYFARDGNLDIILADNRGVRLFNYARDAINILENLRNIPAAQNNALLNFNNGFNPALTYRENAIRYYRHLEAAAAARMMPEQQFIDLVMRIPIAHYEVIQNLVRALPGEVDPHLQHGVQLMIDDLAILLNQRVGAGDLDAGQMADLNIRAAAAEGRRLHGRLLGGGDGEFTEKKQAFLQDILGKFIIDQDIYNANKNNVKHIVSPELPAFTREDESLLDPKKGEIEEQKLLIQKEKLALNLISSYMKDVVIPFSSPGQAEKIYQIPEIREKVDSVEDLLEGTEPEHDIIVPMAARAVAVAGAGGPKSTKPTKTNTLGGGSIKQRKRNNRKKTHKKSHKKSRTRKQRR